MGEQLDDTSVRVAVRVRPQSAKEKIDMCQICTTVTPDEPQIFLGKDKAFTYDYVFDITSMQNAIYNNCARSLIEGCFEGYNATIFAYGQTGAGKTYTMGTGFDMNLPEDSVGIIPRAVEHLFHGIQERMLAAQEAGEPPPDFKVNAQFMELYNEEILDLLDTTRDPSEARGKKSHIRIHEDACGNIYTVGVTTKPVTSAQDTMQYLQTGALSRTTASTNMNTQSSRSHAIFTLHIKQIRVVKEEVDGDDEGEEKRTQVMNEFETLTAKFHFVDLAGSERLKRTGATGDRAKEGISINCGLLALGNVISALGDQTKKGSHVPYRDSKLTRLLQDSLGGNSRTVMIACVSPSDRDFMETLNTMKYANRARNIKNKVTVNQDKTSKQIAALRSEIMELQQELMDYKTGKRLVGEDGVETVNDMFHENTMLQTENNNLRQRIKAMQETLDGLTLRNSQLLSEKELLDLANLPNDKITQEIKEIVENHVKEVEILRAKLLEAEALAEGLKRTAARTPSRASMSPMGHIPMTGSSMDFAFGMTSPDQDINALLAEAKQDVKRDMRRKKTRTLRPISQESDKENVSEEEKQDHEDLESPDKEEASEIVGDDGTDDEITEIEEDEEGGGEDLEELSESDDDTETESTRNPDNIHEDLAKLTCEISIKQKLIEELEHSQKQLQNMKQHYEHKLMSLHSKIQETEIERDRVLANLGCKEKDDKGKEKKVREEYERKLSGMQNDVKKLQAAVKEHAKHMRNQQMNEKKLRQMQQELSDIKKNKVQLMNKMKDEAQKNRTQEARRAKEIAQLKKETRVRDTQIKSLEAKQRQKDIVLRRKQEEVESLRKRQKPTMSAKTAGRVGKYDKVPTKPVSNVGVYRSRRFSPKAAKRKWDNLEKAVSSLVTKKQTLYHMEKDMDRRVKERFNIVKKLEKFQKKREKAAQESQDDMTVKDLDDQIESLKSNLDYIQENIRECQTNIVQMEETSKEEDPMALLNVNNLEEAKYLLEHFVSLSISKGLSASQKESENQELTQKLNYEKQNATYQQEILQYLIKDHVEIEIDDSIIKAADEESESGSAPSSRSVSPIDSLEPSPVTTPILAPPVPIGSSTPDTNKEKLKARRKTATTEDLLYAGATPNEAVKPLLPVIETPDEVKSPAAKMNGTPSAPETAMMPPPKVPPAAGSKIPSRPNSAGPSPNLGGRKNKADTTTPTMRRKAAANNAAPVPAAGAAGSRQSSGSDTAELTPPTSPTSARRVRDENVFNRLTNHARIRASPRINRGKISQASSRMQKSAPLLHSFSADGHTKAVLSVYATNDLLFSSSKDRTAKVWDLHTGQENVSLSGHPNNVVCVRYNEYTQLVYTVSTYFIKLWDLRDSARCVKTLTSAGLINEGPLSAESTSRQVTCPPGETNITDISVSSSGTVMYSSAGNTVKIWDIRSYKSVGKLAGGHQSAVMVLAVDDTDTADGNICVVTGSKDHYIKVFEVSEDSVGMLTPKYNLEPPHYDGIQSLCLMGDLLFSGSRDMCIKKWDLADQQLRNSINGAHKHWVTGLTFTPGGNSLLSGCRGGFLKLWNIETCAMQGEIKAHEKPINSITTNDNLVFSASDDRSVRIWQPQGAGFDSDVE